MPHQSLKLIPGVDQNKTLALNEAAISNTNLVRFIPDRNGLGLVQKLGGWTKYYFAQMTSTVRALWAWEDTNGQSYLGVGAEGIPVTGQSLRVIRSGSLLDITPQTSSFNVPVSVLTAAGSNTVTITHTASNIDNFDTVYIRTPISVGGIILFGQYQCFAVGPDTYNIFPLNALGQPYNATFSTTTISGATAVGTGTTATLTFAGSYTFPVNTAITVSGMSNDGFNGTYIVTASTLTTVSYANATLGSGNSGTISNRGVVPLFTTTNLSDRVVVTLPNHNYQAGDTFPVLIAITVGGITLEGNFIVNQVINSYSFAISGANTATSSTSAFLNSGNANYLYYNGLGPLPAGSGYGVGEYGRGGYGTGVAPTGGSTGTPITATDWTLDNWGEVFVSCPLDGPIYTWNPTAGDDTALVIPEAPPVNAGVFVAMPQRQMIAWGSTFTGVQDPLLIRWSDIANYNEWTAQITNQAGSYRIPKGSRIIQCIQGPQQGLIWTDLGVWAMQYVGPPYVYQFNELGTGCGLIGRKAATSVNGVVYWMGPSQFFRLAGSGVEPIRCPIWDVIFQDLDTSPEALNKIRVAPNSRFGEISWFYPTRSNGGEVSHYVKYNFLIDQWDFGTLARTAWINESVLGPPIGAAPDRFIYQHETSTDADGQPINASFQTGYFALSEADVKMFIDQVWPDMKWGYYGGAQSAEVQLTFYVTDYAGQTPLTYGPFNLTQATTYVTPRFRGRLVSIKVESDDIGSFWRIGNIRYRIQPDGKY
jgi:hypothetical protein